MRTGSCRFSADAASFPPAVIKRRPVNDGGKSLQNVSDEKNGEGACGQQFGVRGGGVQVVPQDVGRVSVNERAPCQPHRDAKWGKEASFKGSIWRRSIFH